MNKKILLGLGLPMVIGLPVLTTLSCAKSSSNTNDSTSVKTFKTLVKRPGSRNTVGAVTLPADVNIYDGNENPNAQAEIEKIKESLTAEQLNHDFQKVLTDFYESYELEKPNYEVEIEEIKVISKNPDGTFKLEVTYEKETEETKESNDSEMLIKKQIDWTPNLKLISKDEITEIKETIKKYSMGNENNSGIDLSDIYEIFFGENEIDDDDDFGIFDKIAKLNKDYDSLAYLLGYEISIDDIYSKLEITGKKNKTVDTKTKFTVPSLYLNTNTNTGSNGSGTIFLPDKKPKIDLTPKTNLTKADLDQIFKNDSAEPSADGAIIIMPTAENDFAPIIDKLNQVLVKPITADNLNNAQIKIKFLALIAPIGNAEGAAGQDDLSSKYQVIIEYDTKGLEADMIVLTPAPETNPLPPAPVPARS